MEVASQALRSMGVPRTRIHVERFISLSGNPFEQSVEELPADGDEATVEVELDGREHSFSWPRNKRLLDLLLEKGLAAPYSCREGACSACACRIEAGEGTPDDLDKLLDIADNIFGKSFCALGDGATSPITSGVKYFRQEFLDLCKAQPAVARPEQLGDLVGAQS